MSTCCFPSVSEEFFDQDSSLFLSHEFCKDSFWRGKGYFSYYPRSLFSASHHIADNFQTITIPTNISLFSFAFWYQSQLLLYSLPVPSKLYIKALITCYQLMISIFLLHRVLYCGMAAWHKSVQLSRALQLLVANGSTARLCCVALWTPWWSLLCQSSYPGVQYLKLLQGE